MQGRQDHPENDVIRIQTEGGGGYGDPAKRSLALIAKDIESVVARMSSIGAAIVDEPEPWVRQQGRQGARFSAHATLIEVEGEERLQLIRCRPTGTDRPDRGPRRTGEVPPAYREAGTRHRAWLRLFCRQPGGEVFSDTPRMPWRSEGPRTSWYPQNADAFRLPHSPPPPVQLHRS